MREVESGQKTGERWWPQATFLLPRQPALPGTMAGRTPGTGPAPGWASSTGQGTWGQAAALPSWGPSADSWQAAGSPGLPPPAPRGTFTFYFLH